MCVCNADSRVNQRSPGRREFPDLCLPGINPPQRQSDVARKLDVYGAKLRESKSVAVSAYCNESATRAKMNTKIGENHQPLLA